MSGTTREKVAQKARSEVAEQLMLELEKAIKIAVPHPEYEKIWRDAILQSKYGDIPGAVQLAIDMEENDRKKVLPYNELWYSTSKYIVGEPQRIKSPERIELENYLKEYVSKTWKSKPTLKFTDNYGTYAGIYTNIIQLAGYRARSREEAEAIVDVIVLGILSEPNQIKFYPDAIKEFAMASIKLDQIREGLPKYVPPTAQETAISQLLAYYEVDEVKKQAIKASLQKMPIEKINERIKSNRSLLVEPAIAKLEAAEVAALKVYNAAHPVKKGGWFSRSSRKSRTRKQRKN
jgi:hypothetical protein